MYSVQALSAFKVYLQYVHGVSKVKYTIFTIKA